MSRVMRLLFRIDYQVNYKIMDQLGEILGIVQISAPKYWQTVGESRGNRSAVLQRKDSSIPLTANFTVDISSIGGTLELPEGADWDSRTIAEYVKYSSVAVAGIMNKYQMMALSRIGLRVVIFDYDEIIRNNRRAPFETLADRTFLRDFENSFGTISDLALTLEGKTPSNVHYRLSAGPGSPSDILRHQLIPPESYDPPADISQHQLTADIDMFESDISFVGNTLEAWSRTKWPIAKDMIAFTKRQILGDTHVG